MMGWGWVKKVGRKVKRTAKKIAKKAKEVADDIKQTFNDFGDDAANKVEEWSDDLGDRFGDNRVGNIIKYMGAIFAATIRAGFDSIGVGIGSAIKTGVLCLTGDFKLFWEGLTDAVSSSAGSVIVVVGLTLSLIGTLLTITDSPRYLTKEEKAILWRVFHYSLKYKVIKITTGDPGFLDPTMSGRAFVLGNHIYMNHNRVTAELLVHEGTHVWQYQNRGNRYVTDALYAQAVVPDEYNWEREIKVRNKDDWEDFNGEAQAEFLEDLWAEGKLSTHQTLSGVGHVIEEGNGSFYDADWKSEFGIFEIENDDDTTSDYTLIAKKAVETVRGRHGMGVVQLRPN